MAFADHLEDPQSSVEEAAPGTSGGRPAGRRAAGEDVFTAAAAAPAVTSARARPQLPRESLVDPALIFNRPPPQPHLVNADHPMESTSGAPHAATVGCDRRRTRPGG